MENLIFALGQFQDFIYFFTPISTPFSWNIIALKFNTFFNLKFSIFFIHFLIYRVENFKTKQLLIDRF